MMRSQSRLIRSLVLIAAAWLCNMVPPASSYDVIEVQHGGTLDGRVTLSGSIPEPKGFNLITFPDPAYCGRISNGKGWRLLHDFIVDSEGGLKNAIVTLEGIEAGKPFDLSVPLIEARDCIFQPWVTIVRNGHAVEVVNMDPVMHDIQGYETSPEAGARVLFNTPLILNHQHQRGNIHAIHNHAPGKSLVGPIYLNKGRRTFYMQCGFHAYMESWADGRQQSLLCCDGRSRRVQDRQCATRDLPDGRVASAVGSGRDADHYGRSRRDDDGTGCASGTEGKPSGLQSHG